MGKRRFNFKDGIIIIMVISLCIVLFGCPAETQIPDPTPGPTSDPTPATTSTASTTTSTASTTTSTASTTTSTASTTTSTASTTTSTASTTTSTISNFTLTMGFEPADDMTGWVSINGDGGYNTQYETDTKWILFNGASYAHSGDRVICSLYNDDGTPNDDLLVTPQILPTSSSTFSMWAAPVDPDYAEESFYIRYSTDMDTFTELYYYQYSSGDTNWRQHSVSLSSLAGQNIYIAIHCTSDYQYILRVDDITITNLQSISESRDNSDSGNSLQQIKELQGIPSDRYDLLRHKKNKNE